MPFEPGNDLGAAGRPARGLQSVADRMAHFLETRTIDDIEKLVRNKKEWRKLTAIDGIIVRRIAAALTKAGSNPDFTAVLDRFVGRPVQPIAAEFKVTHGLAARIDDARRKLRGNADAVVSSAITQTIIDHSNNE